MVCFCVVCGICSRVGVLRRFPGAGLSPRLVAWKYEEWHISNILLFPICCVIVLAQRFFTLQSLFLSKKSRGSRLIVVLVLEIDWERERRGGRKRLLFQWYCATPVLSAGSTQRRKLIVILVFISVPILCLSCIWLNRRWKLSPRWVLVICVGGVCFRKTIVYAWLQSHLQYVCLRFRGGACISFGCGGMSMFNRVSNCRARSSCVHSVLWREGLGEM